MYYVFTKTIAFVLMKMENNTAMRFSLNAVDYCAILR